MDGVGGALDGGVRAIGGCGHSVLTVPPVLSWFDGWGNLGNRGARVRSGPRIPSAGNERGSTGGTAGDLRSLRGTDERGLRRTDEGHWAGGDRWTSLIDRGHTEVLSTRGGLCWLDHPVLGWVQARGWVCCGWVAGGDVVLPQG